MELHERLTNATPPLGRDDPFADLKNRIHFTVIGDLGPQLYNVSMEPEDLRELVLAYTRGDIPDYQMAAFCMAVCFRGLNAAETFALPRPLPSSLRTNC